MVAGRIGDGKTVGSMVRMDADLRDRIKVAADSNGRSMNSEIVNTLEQHYPAPKDDFSVSQLFEAMRKIAEGGKHTLNKRDSAKLLHRIDTVEAGVIDWISGLSDDETAGQEMLDLMQKFEMISNHEHDASSQLVDIKFSADTGLDKPS